MLISVVAVKLISAPEVTVKSVLSPSIFSPVPNVIPTFAGITTSAVAVRLILLPAMVKSVPSPDIFSPALPNCNWSPLDSNKPVSATWVKLTSWSSPKFTTAPSAKNKSENSKEEVPKAAPSDASGTKAVEAVIVGATIVLPDCAVKVFAVNWKSSAPAILISIWSSVSAVKLVSPSASKINSLPSKSVPPLNPASTILVPSE